MNATAAWSTQATPLASVVGTVVFTLGVFSIVVAALMLALGGAAWGFSAFACLVLAACLVVLRLYREQDRAILSLTCDSFGNFHVAGETRCLELVRVWSGPGWVTLGLRAQRSSGRLLRLVIWKSVTPAPFWSELALRIEAIQMRGQGN